MGEVEHNCGVGLCHSLHDAYDLGNALQHRGREAGGIVAQAYDGRIDAVRWVGRFNEDVFDLEGLHHIFANLHGGSDSHYHSFGVHTRYATKGTKDINEMLKEAHPITIGGKTRRYGRYEVIENADAAIVHNGQVNPGFLKDIDLKDLQTSSDTEVLLYFIQEKGVKELLREVPGAYTFAVFDKRLRDVIVTRDRTGIKPGHIGVKDYKMCMASESSALEEIGARPIENIRPGSIYYFSPDGSRKSERIVKPEWSGCFFELFYIAHPDSVIDNFHVRTIRQSLGKEMAREFVPEGKAIVTFVPRCPEVAAEAYAQTNNDLEFMHVFNKSVSERAFMGTNAKERKASIKRNLHLLPNTKRLLHDQEIVLFDDSIVRGNNIKTSLELLAQAGVRRTNVLIYTPPIGIYDRNKNPCGCEWGVDMPPSDEFMARGEDGKNKSPRMIAAEIGEGLDMEVVVKYLTKKGMGRVFKKHGIRESFLCERCIGGHKPFKPEIIVPITRGMS